MGRRGGRARRSTARGRASSPVDESGNEPSQLEVDDSSLHVNGDTTEVAADADDNGATPAAESEAAAPPSDHSSPPVIQPIPRRKRLGRPPKNKPPDWDLPDPNPDAGSESGTPTRRGRGRGRGGGGRGRGRGGPAQVTQVAVDKEGTMMNVADDEVLVPEDPEGETKVDKFGNLLEGREYRVRVFTLLGRNDRLYMLSTEPARCTGYRDSYLFFTKHLRLFKVIIGEDEKRDLIDREVIPHSYKGRAIGVVTARSVFREFGAKIVVGGKRILDDYYVQQARARGDVEGELADPHDVLPPPGESYNKNQFVAWHGASSVYHSNAPAMPAANARVPVKRRTITSENWKYEHALSAVEFNRSLREMRRATQDGVYDIHTNILHYPRNTQPTMCRTEPVLPDSPLTSTTALTNGTSALSRSRSSSPAPATRHHLTNGINGTTSNGPASKTQLQQHNSLTNTSHPITYHDHSLATRTRLPPVPSAVSRNALVLDVAYSTPPFTPTTTTNAATSGLQSLFARGRMADLPADTYACLDDACKAAWDRCREAEDAWYAQWVSKPKDASALSDPAASVDNHVDGVGAVVVAAAKMGLGKKRSFADMEVGLDAAADDANSRFEARERAAIGLPADELGLRIGL